MHEAGEDLNVVKGRRFVSVDAPLPRCLLKANSFLARAEIGNSAKQHETLNMAKPVPARFLKFTILSGCAPLLRHRLRALPLHA